MISSSIYVEFISNDCKENCPICLESINEGEAVAHEGEGNKHPIHKICAIANSKVSPLCPNCRVLVDASPLITFKDKVIEEINFMAEDASTSCIHGIVLTCLQILFGKLAALLYLTTVGILPHIEKFFIDLTEPRENRFRNHYISNQALERILNDDAIEMFTVRSIRRISSTGLGAIIGNIFSSYLLGSESFLALPVGIIFGGISGGIVGGFIIRKISQLKFDRLLL